MSLRPCCRYHLNLLPLKVSPCNRHCCFRKFSRYLPSFSSHGRNQLTQPRRSHLPHRSSPSLQLHRIRLVRPRDWLHNPRHPPNPQHCNEAPRPPRRQTRSHRLDCLQICPLRRLYHGFFRRLHGSIHVLLLHPTLRHYQTRH